MATKQSVITAIDAALAEAHLLPDPQAPNPTISNFVATPSTVAPGELVTFSADVQNALVVKLGGIAVTLPTTRAPIQSGAYVLTAEGAPGTTPAAATVNVTVTQPSTNPPPLWVTQVVNKDTLVALNVYCLPSGNYDRKQDMETWKGNSINIGFGGKAGHLLTPGVYTITLYDFETEIQVGSATTTVTAATAYWQFTAYSITSLPGAWYRTRIVGPAGQSFPDCFVLRYVAGMAIPPRMPSYTGSYETMSGGWPHRWAKVPSTFTPRARPLTPRVHESFTTALPREQLHREYLMPLREGYIRRPTISIDGIPNTLGYQAYHFTSLIAKLPPICLLDGPRGIGCKSMITHLEDGRNGKTIGATSWCVFVADATGHLRTLFGFYHEAPAARYDNPAGLKLAGDWTLVPVPLRQLWECWGFNWYKKSLAIDLNAPPVGNPPEPPHVGLGPRMFATSPQTGAVLSAQFNGGGDEAFALFGNRDREAPPKMSVFVSGLNDPWDVVEVDDEVFISVRGANQVQAFNADTGAFKRILCKGPMNLAHVTPSRIVQLDAPLSVVQGGNCVLPEGLYHYNGDIYIGSKAMEQVRKIAKNANDGTTTLVCSPPIDGNSRFMKIAVASATSGFGPPGTVFTATWSIANAGMPEAFLPNGTKWDYSGYGHLAQGRGGLWETTGYSGAVGVGGGRLLVGSSSEVIAVVSKAQPSDPVPNYALYEQGEKDFQPYSLVHGEGGWDFHNFTPPFGVSAAMDYYLTNKGITP